MNLDDLIDRIKEAWATAWSSVEESSIYNTLRERFETLPSSTQKLVIAGCVGVFALIVVLIPLSSVMDASTYVEEFEEKRELIEELLEAQENSLKTPPIPPGLDANSLQTQIRSRLSTFRLTEAQVPQLTVISNPAEGIAPPVVQQAGLLVSLKGLNLRQTVEIGTALEALHQSIKMMGMEVKSSSEFPKYYDVAYKLVSFSMPQLAPPSESPNEEKRPRRPRRGDN